MCLNTATSTSATGTSSTGSQHKTPKIKFQYLHLDAIFAVNFRVWVFSTFYAYKFQANVQKQDGLLPFGYAYLQHKQCNVGLRVRKFPLENFRKFIPSFRKFSSENTKWSFLLF